MAKTEPVPTSEADNVVTFPIPRARLQRMLEQHGRTPAEIREILPLPPRKRTAKKDAKP